MPTPVHEKPPCSGELIATLTEFADRARAAQAAVNAICEAPLDHKPVILHEPDPVLAPDAGQFFSVVLLDHEDVCHVEDCVQATRLAVRCNDGESHELEPACKDHVHLLFADFLVGA